MPKKLKPEYKYAKYLMRCVLPRCRVCYQLLIATCDRNLPSKLVEFEGIQWLKTKPQKIMMFPTAEEQSTICPHCESLLHPLKVGKES